MHDAIVTAFSMNPWDTRLTLAVECSDCGSQWGWTPDVNGASARLEALAEDHRRNESSRAGLDTPERQES